MATSVVMPQMGYDMKEGTVVRWRKREGDEVSRGEVIAEIETDKATVEMEAYSTGVLGKIVVEEGKSVPVGDLIAVITEPGEPLPATENLTSTPKSDVAATDSTASPNKGKKVDSLREVKEASKDAVPSGQVRATPIARRLAIEKGIDLTKITGTGPGGRVTESDVLALDLLAATGITEATSVAVSSVPTVGKVELTRMRLAIARVTTQSKREIPHFYVTSEIDMTKAVDFRKTFNESLQDGTKVSVNDLVVKATAKALVTYPNFNSSLLEDELHLHSEVNIGIAISLEQGLIVPAIRSCQNKSLVDIAMASSDLIERAQGGHLRADEYTGGTFSISNMGMFEVDSFAAIIFPPNAAVLAVGTVKEQPVVRDGQVVVAHIMKATISVDHRVADGAEGARFLMEVKSHLDDPSSLLL